tara:strand:+ start:857 stop:1297 length:441 start_codon:yes stop_codon:yes gene_type:complete
MAWEDILKSTKSYRYFDLFRGTPVIEVTDSDEGIELPVKDFDWDIYCNHTKRGYEYIEEFDKLVGKITLNKYEETKEELVPIGEVTLDFEINANDKNVDVEYVVNSEMNNRIVINTMPLYLEIEFLYNRKNNKLTIERAKIRLGDR